MSDCAIDADRQVVLISNQKVARVPSDADLLDPAARKVLDDIQRRVRVALEEHIKSGLQIGRLLLEAKGVLKHGSFMPWVQENIRISSTTVAAYMNAAAVVNKFPSLENLALTTLSAIAKAPPELVEIVADEVLAGARPTHRDVVDRCKAARDRAKLTAAGAADLGATPKLAATDRLAILEVLERLVAHTGGEERSLLRAHLQEMEPEEVKAAVLAALDRPAKSMAEAEGTADQGAETPTIGTSSPDNQPDILAAENDDGGSQGCSSPTATIMDKASVRKELPVRMPAAARAPIFEDMPPIPAFLVRNPDNSLPDLSCEPRPPSEPDRPTARPK